MGHLGVSGWQPTTGNVWQCSFMVPGTLLDMFHRVNFPAKLAQFLDTGYVRLAAPLPPHHPKCLAVAIHDTWDYAKHVPKGFIGLTFQLI